MFGRKFDQVQFGWESGTQAPCLLYESDQILSQANDWLGVNITGYSSSSSMMKPAGRRTPDLPRSGRCLS